MNTIKKNLFKYTLTIAFLALMASPMLAQPGPPPGGGGGDTPPCWPPPCIPIDGGIGWLIAAGLAYGGKKVYQNKFKP